MTSKLQSIFSYLGLLFWLIAFFGGKDQRDDNSRYHLKQGLGLIVFTIILYAIVFGIGIASPGMATILLAIGGLGLFIILVIGIINAANDAKKPLPLIGKIFEDKFTFID